MISIGAKTSSHPALASLANDQVDIDRLAEALEALDIFERVQAIRSIGASHQAAIWEACEGRGTKLSDIVPSGVGPSVEVVHAGKNSLPIFSHFEKRFCRTARYDDRLYGYNEGSTRQVIGPGYFVAVEDNSRDEVGINYYEVPPSSAELPVHWPEIRRNEQGLQRFVYSKMIDYLRKVSSSVTIGRAYRQGRAENAYFLLCRTGYEGD